MLFRVNSDYKHYTCLPEKRIHNMGRSLIHFYKFMKGLYVCEIWLGLLKLNSFIDPLRSF